MAKTLHKLYVKSFDNALYENDINRIQATCGLMKYDYDNAVYNIDDSYNYSILVTWHGDKNHRNMYPKNKETAENVFVLSEYTGNYEMPQTIIIDANGLELIKLPLCIITAAFNLYTGEENIIKKLDITYDKDGVIIDTAVIDSEILLCLDQFQYINIIDNMLSDDKLMINLTGQLLIHGIINPQTSAVERKYQYYGISPLNETNIVFSDPFELTDAKLLLSEYSEMKLKPTVLSKNHAHIISLDYDIPGWWKYIFDNTIYTTYQCWNFFHKGLDIIIPPNIKEQNIRIFLPKWTERLQHNYKDLIPLTNKSMLNNSGGSGDTIIVNKGTNLAREIIVDDLKTLEAKNAQKAFEILSYKELEGYHIVNTDPSMTRDDIQEVINKQAHDVNAKCIALYLETGDYYFNRPLEFCNFRNGRVQILGVSGDEYNEEKHVKIHHTRDFIAETTEISATLLQQQRALIMAWGCEYFYIGRIQIEVRPADLDTYFDCLCGVYLSNIQFGLALYNHVNCDKTYDGWAAAFKVEQGQYNITQNYIGGFRFGIDTSHVGLLKVHANQAPTDTRFDTNWYNLHSTGGFMIYPPSSNNMKYSIADCVANTGFIVNKDSCILT